MRLSDYIEKYGDEHCSEIFGAKLRTVRSWKYGDRCPGPAMAAKIERTTRGDVTFSECYAVVTEQAADAPSEDPSRSKPRPLPTSGRGANPGCPTDDPESTDAAAVSDVNQTAGARKTAGRDVREVV